MKQTLLPIALLIGLNAAAQEASVSIPTSEALQATVTNDLTALNTHYQGLVAFKIDKRDRLVADYLEGGSPYRTDVAYFDFLDATACAYNAEEKTVTLQCQDERSKCIDKEIHKTRIISPTGRMNLPIPAGDANGEKARALISKLVEDKQNEQLTRLAEVNTRGDRKK